MMSSRFSAPVSVASIAGIALTVSVCVAALTSGVAAQPTDLHSASRAASPQTTPEKRVSATGHADSARLARVIFWMAVGLIAYTYGGYGLAIATIARLKPRAVRGTAFCPTVSIVVVAHNESSRIADRITNLLTIDYPPDRLEIIIASDGSTDDTPEQVRQYPDVRLREFPIRRGKPAVLNDVIPTVRGEIVALADARQSFDKRALAALVRNFADPAVGAVSGALMLRRSDQTSAAVDGAAMYWNIEKGIRWSESRFDSTIGVTGAIYALRRTAFRRLPEDIILDDVLLPMRITRLGYRVVFEREAVAYDRCAGSAREEFARKVRTIAGNFQLLARERWLMSPFQNRLWIQTISHKVLRLVLPVFYVAMFGANLMLLRDPFFQVTAAGISAFSMVGALSWFAPGPAANWRLLKLPAAFWLMTWATIVGFFRFATEQQRVTWDNAEPERMPAPDSVHRLATHAASDRSLHTDMTGRTPSAARIRSSTHSAR